MQKEGLIIAGVDEAGRGPLAGPVVAAAVILDSTRPIRGLKDSKLLLEKRREELYEEILARCLAFGVGQVEPAEIDSINILQATFKAMQIAVAALQVLPQRVLVDGNQCPKLTFPTEAIINGDQKIAAISAASIIAKVTRDRQMREFDKVYPGYSFAQHKGYATKKHLEALQKLGPCLIHRQSYAPVVEYSR